MKRSGQKRKMQNVSFNTVEEFFEFIPPHELKIVEALRKLVFECIPDCEEKLSYNVPFYKRNANICFIWPASVTWSGMKQEGVRFGFTSGHLLADEINYLSKEKRKQVYWKDFKSLQEIDGPVLRAYLHEALLVDQEKKKNKRTKK